MGGVWPHIQNWRHVTKSLNLLDYLVKNGSDQVVDYANRHIADIKTLKARTLTQTSGNEVHRERERETYALAETDRHMDMHACVCMRMYAPTDCAACAPVG